MPQPNSERITFLHFCILFIFKFPALFWQKKLCMVTGMIYGRRKCCKKRQHWFKNNSFYLSQCQTFNYKVVLNILALDYCPRVTHACYKGQTRTLLLRQVARDLLHVLPQMVMLITSPLGQVDISSACHWAMKKKWQNLKDDILPCKNIKITTDLASLGNDANLGFWNTFHKISEK